MIQTSIQQSRIALVLSIVLYMLCFTQPALCISGNCNGWSPRSMLVLGILNFINLASWGAGIAWLANPLLVLSWWLAWYFKYDKARNFGLAALLMALSLLITKGYVLAADEGPTPITGFGIGYWLWVGAIALGAISGLLGTGAPPTDPVSNKST